MSGAPPVVRVGETLVAAMHEDIDDDSALALVTAIGDRVVAERVRSVILDVSAAHFVDSFICRVISDIAATARLLGAAVAVVGMRPAVAITLVELGLTLEGVVTARDVDEGRLALHRPAAADGKEAGRAARDRRHG